MNNMKARVISTGEIISLDEKSTVLDANPCNFNSYEISELEILYENTNFPKDYWQKLLHQYAGMAMQAMLTSPELMQVVTSAKELLTNDYAKRISVVADRYAHALVEKMKETK